MNATPLTRTRATDRDGGADRAQETGGSPPVFFRTIWAEISFKRLTAANITTGNANPRRGASAVAFEGFEGFGRVSLTSISFH